MARSCAYACVAAVAVAVLAAACGGTALSRSGPTVVPCFGPTGADSCRSPDGAWSARLRGTPNDNQTLVLTDLRSGRHVLANGDPGYPHTCCGAVTWVKPHLVLFWDWGYETVALRPPSTHERILDGGADFEVSPDGHWVATESTTYEGDPELPQTVDVVSTAGKICVANVATSNLPAGWHGLWNGTVDPGILALVKEHHCVG